MNKKHSQSGLTLVELSIVLILMGLIVAGVTAGQTLQKQAKLRSIATDINKYQVAIESFKIEYRALPGDFANATAYWGSGVVNGNGNGYIENVTIETAQFWKHLQNAGLIKDSLTGQDASGNYNAIGINIPQSSYSKDVGLYASSADHQIFNAPPYNDRITFGSQSQSCNAGLNGRVLTPADAKSFDTKVDDGIATRGKYYSLRGAIPSICGANRNENICVTAHYHEATSADWVLSDTDINCRLIYWLDK